MQNRDISRWVGLLLLLAWIGPLAAHGLNMTSVEVVQRQSNHLTLTLQTPLSPLFSRMEYPDKPPTLMHLAGGTEETLASFRQRLLALMQEQTRLLVAQQPLESVRIYIPPIEELRALIQDQVSEQVLNHSQSGSDSETSRHHNTLRLALDGFIPDGPGPRTLEASFPKELGPILISYSRPQVQTLSPDDQGSRYRQLLQWTSRDDTF